MRRLTLWIGIVLVTLLVLAALVSLVWTPFDPTKVLSGQPLSHPGWPHLLGTDAMGIDTLSRMLAGSRITVVVGVVAVAIAAVIGVPWGVAAGMWGGWGSEVLMRASDILYAFPALLLAILLTAALGASVQVAMVAIGIATIPAFARVARAGTLQVMGQDYVEAARVSGTRGWGIAVRHVAPNIAPLVGVQASVSFGIAILAEAGLSYLGLSAPPTTPTWGRMLKDAQAYLFVAPEQAWWPGLAIAAAVLGFNLLGDGLRDLLDPRLREVR